MNNADLATMPYSDPTSKPPVPGAYWNGYSWTLPRPLPGGFGAKRIRRVYIQQDPNQTPPIAVIPGQDIPTYPPPFNPYPETQTPPPLTAMPGGNVPVPVTNPTNDTTATNDLLWGYPKNYVYIAGAGAAVVAVIVIYLAMSKK